MDAVNIFRLLTSSRGDHPPSRERASCKQVEALRTDLEVSGEEGVLPQGSSIRSSLISSLLASPIDFELVSSLSTPDASPACLAGVGLASAHGPLSQFLKISLIRMSRWFCFSGELQLTREVRREAAPCH